MCNPLIFKIIMSFQFPQAWGSNHDSTDSKDHLKIEKSELQRRRAEKILKSTNKLSFAGSFFTGRTGNSLASSSSQFMKTNRQGASSNGRLVHPPLNSSSPLLFASGCVTNMIEKDNSTPPIYDILSKYAVDNYNYKPNITLGPFSRFEKAEIYNIPDSIFRKYKSFDCITNMGVFPELQRAWLAIDDKLIIWNYSASSAPSSDLEYYTIDDFKSTILDVRLMKPKANVFVNTVKYIILVSTVSHIRILAVQTSKEHVDISDTKMSVSTQGLLANKFVCYDRTGEVFFTGAGDNEGIWKLKYTSDDEWFSRNCSKECLTKSSMSTVLPSVLSNFTSFLGGSSDITSKAESIIELKLDQSRGILYTLSSKSIIKAYRLRTTKGMTTLGYKITKRPFDLLKELSTTTVNLKTPLLARNKIKIVNIFPISKDENRNLFLVAVTSSGCRIYLNGSTMYGDRLTLTANQTKFPPPDAKFYDEVEKKKQEQLLREQSFMGSNSASLSSTSKSSITKNPVNNTMTVQDLKQAQETSQLLDELSKCLIISPGIFIGIAKGKRLFTSVPDYGILKSASQYIEDFELHDVFERIHSIVQLTPSFNATNTPEGYCNEFASQYTGLPLEFAILTGTGIHVYRYRTPDLILNDSLNDLTFSEFSKKYGSEEACSSSLYLACKYGKSDSFRNLATKYFVSGGKNAKLTKKVQPSVNDVEMSDKLLALIILVSRLVRTFWGRVVFKLKPEVKFNRDGYINVESIRKMKSNKVILDGLNLTKKQLEYFLCSILILVKFFDENKKFLPALSSYGHSIDSSMWKEKESEVCLQAENMGFEAMIKMLNTVKEGLSFLTILVSDDSGAKSFEDVIHYLPLQSQVDLSCLTFSEFFASSDPYVSRLLKEILSSVINKSIASGNSVEVVANALQEKCGSFCSTGDVLIFKAIESLKKAKDYMNNNDGEMKMNYLRAAVKLLTETADSLSEEIITDCVNIMLHLEYYDGAVKFLLDVANTSKQIKLSEHYEKDISSQILKDTTMKNSYERRLNIYQLIFQILADVDKKAILSLEKASESTLSSTVDMIYSSVNSTSGQKKLNKFQTNAAFMDENGRLITQYSEIRDRCYKVCVSYDDRIFHYRFYEWFIANGVGERLLDLETPFILQFLISYGVRDLNIAKLLWVYYSRRHMYFDASKVLRSLALSDFDLDLPARIEFLSRANGFCRCISAQDLHKDVVILASDISDLISVSNLQDELVLTIKEDTRINNFAKKNAISVLNSKILSVSDLYNNYIDPLGYYELGLLTFKISDHRNAEDIRSKWESLFGKWYYLHLQKKDAENEPFYQILSGNFVFVGSKLSNTDVLFPIMDIFELLAKYMYSDEFSKRYNTPAGSIVDCFVGSGVPYDKLYYNLRNIIEATTFEVFKGYLKILDNEMCYLIKSWYKEDKTLRDAIPDSSMIRTMQSYSIKTDPIYEYIKSVGKLV